MSMNSSNCKLWLPFGKHGTVPAPWAPDAPYLLLCELLPAVAGCDWWVVAVPTASSLLLKLLLFLLLPGPSAPFSFPAASLAPFMKFISSAGPEAAPPRPKLPVRAAPPVA